MFFVEKNSPSNSIITVTNQGKLIGPRLVGTLKSTIQAIHGRIARGAVIKITILLE